jgi:thiamine pyrophosphate-dependent acetolactate synthase large subunit-like protein
MMQRSELLRVIFEARTDEIVVTTMSAVKDWRRLSSSPLDFHVAGAMGYASSVGLGLALAQPNRKVIVLDGDGSLLMNLGTLVTIADVQPENLIHFVLENQLYEVPGGIPLPGVGKHNLAAFARAAGLTRVHEFEQLADFREHVGAILREPGPTFASLRVARGPSEPLPPIRYAEMARNLERALK